MHTASLSASPTWPGSTGSASTPQYTHTHTISPSLAATLASRKCARGVNRQDPPRHPSTSSNRCGVEPAPAGPIRLELRKSAASRPTGANRAWGPLRPLPSLPRGASRTCLQHHTVLFEARQFRGRGLKQRGLRLGPARQRRTMVGACRLAWQDRCCGRAKHTPPPNLGGIEGDQRNQATRGMGIRRSWAKVLRIHTHTHRPDSFGTAGACARNQAV